MVTVAHRLSTIVDSDIIFVVHDGVIAAQGTHEELLKNCDFYANLVRGQMETSSMYQCYVCLNTSVNVMECTIRSLS